MVKIEQEIHLNRSRSNDFLLNKTDSRPIQKQVKKKQFNSIKILQNSFPGILSGDKFIDAAMDFVEPLSSFQVMAVKIDNFYDLIQENKEIAGKVLISAAKTIDNICKDMKGFFGYLNYDMLGCYIANGDNGNWETNAAKISEKIKADTDSSVTIGASKYPLINYHKGQFIENAVKAIDHAAFFGSDSTVLFDAVSLNISGDIYYQKGDIHGAMREYNKGLLIDPAEINIHNSLGVCHGVLDNHDLALESFEAAIWLDPDEVMAVYNIGLVHLHKKENKKALKYFTKSHSLQEDLFEPVFQIGTIHEQQGNQEQAISYFKKAVNINPESGATFRSLGLIYEKLENRQDAIQAYKNAIKQNPNDAESLSALGHLYGQRNENLEIALTFCRQSTEITPDNGLYLYRLAGLYQKRDKNSEALEYYKLADEAGHESSKEISKLEEEMMEQ